jgi:GxxExxY protein
VTPKLKARALPVRSARAALRPELLEDRACAGALDAAVKVHRALGVGHAPATYKNALVVELVHAGLRVTRDASFSVQYRGQVVGAFVADLLVEDRVLAQVVASAELGADHRVETLRGLAAGDVKVGLVFNFGAPELIFSRIL